MAEPSIQPESPINPDPLGRSVDRVIVVIRKLLPTEHAALVDELGAALGDMFAELIGRTTSMSASVVTPMIQNQEGIKQTLAQGLAEINQRFDRRQASNADIATALRDIQRELNDHGRRILALERAVNDASADR